MSLAMLAQSLPADDVAAGGAIKTGFDLVAAIEQLKDPGKNLDAVESLIEYAGTFLYEGGSVIMVTNDPAADNRRREATKALYKSTPLPARLRALSHPNQDVRFWAVRATLDSILQQPDLWEDYGGKIKEMASTDPDARIRSEVLERLIYRKDCADFIAKRREPGQETHPSVLMRLLEFNSSDAKVRQVWYQHAALHLQTEDAALRKLWLQVIVGNMANSATAPMWRIHPDTAIIDAIFGAYLLEKMPKFSNWWTTFLY